MSEQPTVDKPRAKRDKRTRIPANGNERNKLTVRHKEPGYEYYWAVNDPDRIAKLKDAWYEVDTDPRNKVVGDRTLDTSAGTSSIVEVGAGRGQKLILMRLPTELWNEDKAAQARSIDESEADMLREAKRNNYGSIEVTRGGISPPVGS